MTSSPSQHLENKPTLSHSESVGFRFLGIFTDTNRDTTMKPYKPAKIYDKGNHWFVYFSYMNPTTRKFKRYKVYENINRYKGADREAYAQELKRAVDGALKKGFNPFGVKKLTVAVKNWTLIQSLNYFKQNLDNKGLAKRSKQSYESVLRMLYTYLDPVKNEPIKDITKQQVSTALQNARKKNSWSNTTFNNNLTFTKAIFNYLIDEEAGILEISPAAKIKPLPQTIVGNQAWTDAEFKLIKEKADPELLRFIMFIYYTCIRPDSCCKLHSDSISIDQDDIFIRGDMIKDKRGLHVPVSKEVIAAYKTNGKIFKWSKNWYTSRFQKLREGLKLSENIKLYSVKHTRARHLIHAGVNPYVIMELFGHSGLDVTMSYLRDAGLKLNREATTKGIRF